MRAENNMNINTYIAVGLTAFLMPLGGVLAQGTEASGVFIDNIDGTIQSPDQLTAEEEEVFLQDLQDLVEAGILQEIPDDAALPDILPPDRVSCFDYYRFGSVQAILTSSVENVVSGTRIEFSGELVNENPYPIVDGSLYVKIFKSRDEDDGNGPDVVDQFFAVSDVSIPANGRVPVSFAWMVPGYAQSGEYELASFFVTSRKFNLLGLPFTDDVVGNTVPFIVAGEHTTGVLFDKSSASINNEPYSFIAFPPLVSKDEPITISARIVNTTGQTQNASLVWTVYYWDSLLRRNAVQEESANVSVPPGGSTPVSITVSDTTYPVYLAVGTLSWKDTKSIIAPRFVREGISRPRINFPSITSFPLMRGEENQVFSCLHNTSNEVATDGRLDLTLLDMDGNLIHNYTYRGDITGAMMGVANLFVPKKTYDRFVLEARLYENGVFVDEARMTYDCSLLGQNACLSDSEKQGPLFSFSGPISLSGGLLLVFILLIAFLLLRPRLMSKQEDIVGFTAPVEGSAPAPTQTKERQP